MDKFIALSPSSKKILKIAQISSDLPVNVIILGSIGVGRKLLAKEILPDAPSFIAKDLEQLIVTNKIDLKQYNQMILYDLNQVINKEEFLQNLSNIKIVVTNLLEDKNYINQFAIKIEISPLKERIEDLNELIRLYTIEAKDISPSSLKQSIYKNILLQSITKQELMDILYDFFIKEFKSEKSYKELLSIFEIPLLKSAKAVYNSQLKMANKLKINRITLRKKLEKYFGE